MQHAFLGHGRPELPDEESHGESEPDSFVVAPNLVDIGVRGSGDRQHQGDEAGDRRGGLHRLLLHARRGALRRHLRHHPQRRAGLRLRVSGTAALEGPDGASGGSHQEDSC